MYRAIRTINGGETIEIKHFMASRDAYAWLTPSSEIQQRDRWHIKLLWTVIEGLRNARNSNQPHPWVSVGNDELLEGVHTYIQEVRDFQTPLPTW